MALTLVAAIALACASGADDCGEPQLVESERQVLGRTGEFAFYSSECPHPQEGPHFDPLPFQHASIGDEVAKSLRRLGVRLVDDPQRMERARPLNFCVGVRRTKGGYDYELHLAPGEWSTDPVVDVEEVGGWFAVRGTAPRESLKREMLRGVSPLAKRFAQEYRKARRRRARPR